jgi:hypothetical protein
VTHNLKQKKCFKILQYKIFLESRLPRLTVSVSVPRATSSQQLPDIATTEFLKEGVYLPRPKDPPPVFMKTQDSELVAQVIDDLQQHGILVPNSDIVYAFRLFLVAKSSGVARPVYDMSPWTSSYSAPHIQLYSVAEVLATIPQNSWMIKIDLKCEFFQIPICPEYQKYYGIYYKKHRLAWTRLPMGHPLAPSIMQRLPTNMARHLHNTRNGTLVAYLDD